MPTILIFYTHIPYYTGITLVYIHELAVKPKQLTGIAGPQVRLRPEAPIMGNFPGIDPKIYKIYTRDFHYLQNLMNM